MSFLFPLAREVWSRIRGPLLPSTPPGAGGEFTPSGADFDAAQSVYTSNGADGHVYLLSESSSLRSAAAGDDGISSGQSIGFANDWRGTGNAARAAAAEGGRRPTLTTVGGVLCASFDGTDDELLWPDVSSWAAGTILAVARLSSTSAANQTILEIGPLRFMAQFTGFTGPTVRVGGGAHTEFGLTSMLDRWTLLVCRFDRGANAIQIWRDGAPAWVEANVAEWDTNPSGTWERGATSLLGRNSYEPTDGAPITGAIASLVAINAVVSSADVQTLADLATRNTGITPDVPSLTPPPTGDELPAPSSEVTLDSQGAFDAWKAGPPPAGQHATLTFNVNLGALTFSGTEAAPIVIKASSILGRSVTGAGDISGNHLRIWGFDWGGVSPGLLTGLNTWFIRCRGANGLKIRFRESGGRAWYCHWNGGSGGRAIAFDTGADGINGHVYRCRFNDWAPGGDNATETITVGFSNNVTLVQSNTLIEECLFIDCNLGGAEDETVAVKSSNVTVRKCTFVRTRWCQVRHGINNLFEACWHEDSGNGGFRIRDGNARMQNCRTVGNSGSQVFAGNAPSGLEDPLWRNIGSHPRGFQCVIDHHEATNSAPRIGVTFSTVFDPLYPADQTLWRANRGQAVQLEGGGRQTNTTVQASSPIAYVAPTKLGTASVGPNA